MTTPAPRENDKAPARLRNLMGRSLGAFAPFFALILVVLIFYAIPPHYGLSLRELQVIFVHTVIVGVAALGMTFIIISGGIDLSVGSGVALAGVTAAKMLAATADWPPAYQPWALPLAIAVAVLTGLACGLYNGLLITLLRLPPFIATLGTLGFYRGVAKWLSNSRPISPPIHGLDWLTSPFPEPGWLIFAPAVWLMLILGIALACVLHFGVLGRHTFAIGSNEATARLCGIHVPRTKVYIYLLGGSLVGLSGLLQLARLTQGDPTVQVGLELEVIAAVVIGGASLTGGQGSLAGTLAGAWIMAFLRNRCTKLELPTYVEEMLVGHIILVAVAIDQWRARRRAR